MDHILQKMTYFPSSDTYGVNQGKRYSYVDQTMYSSFIRWGWAWSNCCQCAWSPRSSDLPAKSCRSSARRNLRWWTLDQYQQLLSPLPTNDDRHSGRIYSSCRCGWQIAQLGTRLSQCGLRNVLIQYTSCKMGLIDYSIYSRYLPILHYPSK